MTKISKD